MAEGRSRSGAKARGHQLRRWAWLGAGLGLGLGSFSGCCTGNLVESVDIKIVDDVAMCPENVAVTAWRDGKVEEAFRCPLAFDDAGGCSCEGAVGSDKSGHFVIAAMTFDGKRQGGVELDVDEGFCHVTTQTRTITLK